MTRQAFGLLLELRARRDAQHCLARAVAFLEVLARDKDGGGAPIVLSIRVMAPRKT
jgi:hypothetical protein